MRHNTQNPLKYKSDFRITPETAFLPRKQHAAATLSQTNQHVGMHLRFSQNLARMIGRHGNGAPAAWLTEKCKQMWLTAAYQRFGAVLGPATSGSVPVMRFFPLTRTTIGRASPARSTR